VFEQRVKERAVYGSELLKRLSGELPSPVWSPILGKKSGADATVLSSVGENPATMSAVSAAGISPKISQTPSCEIESGRLARILAFLVSLGAAPRCNGLGCQTAL
jgi:hypothetical protein